MIDSQITPSGDDLQPSGSQHAQRASSDVPAPSADERTQTPVHRQQVSAASSSRVACGAVVLALLTAFLMVATHRLFAPNAAQFVAAVMFGALGAAILIGPAAAPTAALLDLSYHDPSWETAFLFSDSRGRMLNDALASITACASVTIRLYRALLGDCTASVAQRLPTVAFFLLQATPLAIMCRNSLWYVRHREAVMTGVRLGSAALIAAWSAGCLHECRSSTADANFLVLGLLAAHHAIAFQVRFDRHALLLSVEAAVALLSVLAAPQLMADAPASPRLLVLQWALALVAAPAGAAWLTERTARREFAEQQKMGCPGIEAPQVPQDSYYLPKSHGAAEDPDVVEKLTFADSNPFLPETPRINP